MHPQVEKCIDKWGEGIKVTKGPKGSPFPVVVQRTIERPADAEAWDVERLVSTVVAWLLTTVLFETFTAT